MTEHCNNSNSSSSKDEGGDQPQQKRAKRAAAQKAQARMSKRVAGEMSADDGDDPAEADYDDN